MKIIQTISAFSLSMLLLGCGNTAAPTPEPAQTAVPIEVQAPPVNGTILALGDSLTEGYGLNQEDSYPSQLQKKLRENGYEYDVINSGISGETTTGLLERLNWVLSQDPDIIILTSGANDAMRGTDLNITRQNLVAIIEEIQAKDITLIFSGMEIYDNLGLEYVNQFKSIYADLAEQYTLTYIPFFLEGVAGNPDFNIADQIHPNKEGYERIIEMNIWPVLEPLLQA